MKIIRYAILASFFVALLGCYNIMAPSMQTVSYKTEWPWDSTKQYFKGDMVTMPQFLPGGPIYRSLQDKNMGIEPPSLDTTGQPTYYSSPSPDWQNWWILAGSQE